MRKSKNTVILAESALLIAVSVVLSFIKIWQMPLGGSVTAASMLPLCVIAIRHGAKWGFGSAFVFSLYKLAYGIVADGLLGWGLTPGMFIGCVVFDYVLAFTVAGLAGVFRRYGEGGIYAGITLVCVLRFISHFISGYVIFRNLEQWSLFGGTFSARPALYSVCYNGFFMLPELILTVLCVVILMRIPYMKKKVFIKQ